MCICVISQKNHNFSSDTQIKKIKMVLLQVPLSAKENKFNTSNAYLRICVYSKEIIALGSDQQGDIITKKEVV